MNEYLNQYIGKTSSKKLLFDANQYLIEEKIKQTMKTPNEVCMIHVENPLTKEITGIGGSIPRDLIVNNLGFFLAVHWRNVNAVETDFNTMIDITSTLRLVNLIRQGTSTPFNNTLVGAGGSTVQIGSGSTAPTRLDDSIESPFIVSPESNQIGTTIGLVNVGLGQVSNLTFILAGGAGTIKEAGTIMRWADRGGTDRFFLIARDLISPNVAFVAGQSINITWTWQM